MINFQLKANIPALCHKRSGNKIAVKWIKRSLFLIFGLCIMASCQSKSDIISIKVGLSHGKNHSFTQALERFGDLVEKETNGRYQVKVYHGSQLGSEKEMQEMLTVGSLEMTVTGLLNAYEPFFSVFELPYLYTGRKHVMRVMNSPIVEEVSENLLDKGIRFFGFYENGYRHITNSIKAINTPEDLVGMMIRVPENPAQVETFRALGAIPTPLSFSELYTALVQGVVDGQENPLQNIWYGRLFEAQKHIAMTGHIYNAAYILMSNNFYQSLPEADKKILKKCIAASIKWQLEYMEQEEKGLQQKLMDEGMAFTYPDNDLFKKATLPAYEALYRNLGAKARVIVQRIGEEALIVEEEKAENKKIFYINSYHKGYAPSDDVELGIRETLPERMAMKTFYMDSKRNGTPDAISKKVKEALAELEAFEPDVIIASDDNAVKDIIVPHYKEGAIPVVFCGVNWSAEEYGLPSKAVTGMLEVLPLPQLLDTVKGYYPSLNKMAVLSENTLSEEKNKLVLDTMFRNKGFIPEYLLVNNFEEWKKAFKKLNNEKQLIYLPTNGAIKGWKNEEAVSFVKAHIKNPVVTCDDFMMQFSTLGFTKVAWEQGEWAAKTALEILEGKQVSDIPLTRNKQYVIWYNKDLAQKIGFKPSDKLKEVSKNFVK